MTIEHTGFLTIRAIGDLSVVYKIESVLNRCYTPPNNKTYKPIYSEGTNSLVAKYKNFNALQKELRMLSIKAQKENEFVIIKFNKPLLYSWEFVLILFLFSLIISFIFPIAIVIFGIFILITLIFAIPYDYSIKQKINNKLFPKIIEELKKDM